MTLANQACGIEQQLIELVAQRERAEAERRHDEVLDLSAGIRKLQEELAAVSELAASEKQTPG
ncbi:MAG: hypothetical protein ACRDV9_06175 [Acidimicrobiia bacterium]